MFTIFLFIFLHIYNKNQVSPSLFLWGVFPPRKEKDLFSRVEHVNTPCASLLVCMFPGPFSTLCRICYPLHSANAFPSTSYLMQASNLP